MANARTRILGHASVAGIVVKVRGQPPSIRGSRSRICSLRRLRHRGPFFQPVRRYAYRPQWIYRTRNFTDRRMIMQEPEGEHGAVATLLTAL